MGQTEEYRQRVDDKLSALTTDNAIQTTDIGYIKKGVDTLIALGKEQNGRIRKNENKISFIFGIGAITGVVLSLMRMFL